MNKYNHDASAYEDYDRGLRLEAEGLDDIQGLFAKEIATIEEREEIAMKRFVTAGLIKEGQIVTIYGNGGAGKTSIVLYFAMEWIERFDKQVIYISMDGDNPMTLPLEKLYKDKFIAISKGSPMDILNRLLKLNSKTLSQSVFIFDTYKKFTADVNSKGANVALFEKLRVMQGNGATVIMLAHTNKDKGSHSGTADIEQDGDCMLRVSGIKKDSVLTSSIKLGGRTRWEVTPRTFTMSIDKYPDVTTAKEIEFKDLQQVENEIADMAHIEAIKEILTDNPFIVTTELFKIIDGATVLTTREARRLVYSYESTHWNRHKQTDNKTYKWSIVQMH